MWQKQILFSTPAGVSGWPRWLVFSPAARIAFFVIMLLALGYPVGHVVVLLGWTLKSASPLQHALATLAMQLLPSLIGYLLLAKLIEQRQPRELLPHTRPLLAGLAIGAGLISLVVGMLWLAGSYHVLGTQHPANWFAAVLVVGVGAGIGEEIITRGALFRIIEEGLGTWWALAISAAFFGAAHIFNPGATWWSSTAIAIEAGVLLALLYHVTRSLWTCIGMHAAWNVMQGTFYGIPVSGTDAQGWLISSRSGPDWLSGGLFGAEASVVALLVCSSVSVLLLRTAWRRRSIVPPSWRRHRVCHMPPLSSAAS